VGGRVSDVELQPAAVSAMAVRFRASGMELGRARDAHAAAADEAVVPVASAHARAVHRWTEGLRVAASGSSSSRRSRAPQPRSVSRPIARPGSGPSPMRPLRSRPSLSSPVGHCLRGASSTPGRMSRCRVSATADSSTAAS